jgi:hypothetical protein
MYITPLIYWIQTQISKLQRKNVTTAPARDHQSVPNLNTNYSLVYATYTPTPPYWDRISRLQMNGYSSGKEGHREALTREEG